MLSSSARMDQERCCTAIFGFKSGFWLGLEKTFRDLSRSHSCIALGCVLRDVVLLDNELSPQSEVLSSLEQVIIKELSILCSVHLSLDPD